jgi:hypothetical protein
MINSVRICFDYFDAVVALDLKTGEVRWANRAMAYDAWNVNCIQSNPAGAVPGVNCPVPTGADYDFGGAGPNLFSAVGNNNTNRDILELARKAGSIGHSIQITAAQSGVARSAPARHWVASSGVQRPMASISTYRSRTQRAFLTYSSLPIPRSTAVRGQHSIRRQEASHGRRQRRARAQHKSAVPCKAVWDLGQQA